MHLQMRADTVEPPLTGHLAHVHSYGKHTLRVLVCDACLVSRRPQSQVATARA
eukprot:COSAG02_NODE_40563_length_404_cov_0.695082_1_plen_52_part_10